MAQTVRLWNRRHRAVGLGWPPDGDLARFHGDLAMRWGQHTMQQFQAVQALIDQIRNEPEWRTVVLSRIEGSDWRQLLEELGIDARNALLGMDDLSGKTAQELSAATTRTGPRRASTAFWVSSGRPWSRGQTVVQTFRWIRRRSGWRKRNLRSA
jgi:hypothetical protein